MERGQNNRETWVKNIPHRHLKNNKTKKKTRNSIINRNINITYFNKKTGPQQSLFPLTL